MDKQQFSFFVFNFQIKNFGIVAVFLGPVQNVTVLQRNGIVTVHVVGPQIVFGQITFDYIYYPVNMPSQTIEQNDTDSPFNVTNLQENVVYTIIVSMCCKNGFYCGI